MRAERIIELIDEAYPKVKDLVTMTYGQGRLGCSSTQRGRDG